MKPQKKAVVVRKAITALATAKKRRASPEKHLSDLKRDKKSEEKKSPKRPEANCSAKKSEDAKKKSERSDEKKRPAAGFEAEDEACDPSKLSTFTVERETMAVEVEVPEAANKKKTKAEDRRKDAKPGKSRRKDPGAAKSSPSRTKRDRKPKQQQPRKKTSLKKTVLAKKIASRSPVAKKIIEKKAKLVKKSRGEEAAKNNCGDEESKKLKKKSPPAARNKANEKKPKLAKQMKATASRKYPKVNAALKKEEKLKKLADKIAAKKKMDAEKVTSDGKKMIRDESMTELETKNIKKELDEGKEEEDFPAKSPESKKPAKSSSRPKIAKKVVKKSAKNLKLNSDDVDHKSTSSDEVTLEELLKKSKADDGPGKIGGNSKREEDAQLIRIDLKVETTEKGDETGSSASSDAEDEEEDEAPRRNKRRIPKKRDRKSPSADERARRMRLFGFWSGPKRHRVASLNALAKVHCLYENEAGGVYLGGYCKPKPEKDKAKKSKDDKEEAKDKDAAAKKPENSKKEENVSKRKLRNVPGLRGKHWDMITTSSSSSSSSDEEIAKEKKAKTTEKKVTKRRKKNEEVMDLKDMVVCKRMASLNATAMLAASYSDEKHRRGSSSSDTSSESEVEVVRRRKQTESEADRRKSRRGSDPEESIKTPKKVVIVNQDTDVTITGNYHTPPHDFIRVQKENYRPDKQLHGNKSVVLK